MSIIPVTEPTMVLNKEACKSNIARMAAKAKAANVIFRPPFKLINRVRSGMDVITVLPIHFCMTANLMKT